MCRKSTWNVDYLLETVIISWEATEVQTSDHPIRLKQLARSSASGGSKVVQVTGQNAEQDCDHRMQNKIVINITGQMDKGKYISNSFENNNAHWRYKDTWHINMWKISNPFSLYDGPVYLFFLSVCIFLTINAGVEDLIKDLVGCQLVQNTTQELSANAGGRAWQVHWAFKLPGEHLTSCHSWRGKREKLFVSLFYNESCSFNINSFDF